MSGTSLALDQINKRYNPGTSQEVHAVRDFDLNVQAGEIVALLGSSGCGKTSTLRMIAGFEVVSEGRITLGSTAIHTLQPARRNVAMAFEGYSLYPPLTVGENIGFALKSKRLNKAEIRRRVIEIAKLLEIEDIIDRYPSSISGGQQQRVSLGRALVRDADLHLLDEPMGQLEPQLRAHLRGRLKHFIKERELTVILVTHDQTEANALADRIAVMEDGVLQQFDTPERLKDHPANLFTGTFIGEPPMNVFSAEAAEGDGTLTFAMECGVTLRFPSDAFAAELRADVLRKRRVTVGIRPHAVQIADDGIPAEVLVNQWLGDQSHIAARFAGATIVSVIHDRAQLDKGAPIGISIAAEDLHLFDTETGTAISHGGERVAA